MLERLNLKIRQMHAALDALATDELSAIHPQIAQTDRHRFVMVDFGRSSDEVTRANAASQVIANIASLKDYLRAWCRKNSRPFGGDQLVDSNRAVALIHDLWNLDKHAELDRPTRSGCTPRLQNITTALHISAGTESGGGAFFSMDPSTVAVTTSSANGGTVRLVLDAQIIDEHGNNLGDFVQVCDEAAEAWSQAVKAAGVALP